MKAILLFVLMIFLINVVTPISDVIGGNIFEGVGNSSDISPTDNSSEILLGNSSDIPLGNSSENLLIVDLKIRNSENLSENLLIDINFENSPIGNSTKTGIEFENCIIQSEEFLVRCLKRCEKRNIFWRNRCERKFKKNL